VPPGQPDIHGNSYRQLQVDRLIAALAKRQHGVVSRAQLIALGLAPWDVDYRVKVGRLHVLHRGVYAVGHPSVTGHGRWMAAVLACGPGAALSHRSAAALWDLRRSASPAIEVVVARRDRPRLRGITARTAALAPHEVTRHERIPVTTVARTVIDLAAVVPIDRVERALEQAERMRLLDFAALAALAERHARRPGVPALRALIKARAIADGVTRSELEADFLAFLAAHDLPRPEVNAKLHAGGEFIEVDCLWRAQRLIVELDSWEYHHTRDARRRDVGRDRALHTQRWTSLRVMPEDLDDDLAAQLAALLSASAAPRADRSAR
jgi:very-short-patch-repair endonuclease/predicted transcriptional regulator of viral defense system